MPQTTMQPPPIKNKGAGFVQLTAQQILKDAEIHRQVTLKPPSQTIMDEKELRVYTQQKRRQFEDKLRRQRYNLSVWVRYAQWQENLKEFARARSIFERALQIDYTNKSLWLKYAQMQQKNKFINHARNVWERATYYLPRQDQFWFKYAFMEQKLGEYLKTRDIFTRWMQWIPAEKAWMSFIKFEQRMGEFERAKKILYRYLQSYPTLQAYLKVAKFEIKNRNKSAARQIYEKIIIELGSDAIQESYFIDFGKFETKQREYDRARQIFKFGLKQIPKEKATKLYEVFLNFEKEFGSKDSIDEVILGQRRNYYKQIISKNELNYDAWLDLIFLEESFKNVQRIRQVYEAAVKKVPPVQQKRFWRRYIYLWYNYALFEEQIAENLQNAEKVYQRIIKLVPHKKFTFGQLWINCANFYIRCNDLVKARKIFGQSIGTFPKKKVFRAYIELEEKLCQLDRVRILYEKYCENFSNFPEPWREYATFEMRYGEQKRAKGVLEIAHQLKIEGLPQADEFVKNFQEENENEE